MKTKVFLFIVCIVSAHAIAGNKWVEMAKANRVAEFIDEYMMDPCGAQCNLAEMYDASVGNLEFQDLLDAIFLICYPDTFPDLTQKFTSEDGSVSTSSFPELEKALPSEQVFEDVPEDLGELFFPTEPDENLPDVEITNMEEDPTFTTVHSGSSFSGRESLSMTADNERPFFKFGTTDKPFKCPFCTKVDGYRRKGDLNVHVKNKHPNRLKEIENPKSTKIGKNFPCPFHSCQCGFMHNRDLLRHLRKKHPDFDETSVKPSRSTFTFHSF